MTGPADVARMPPGPVPTLGELRRSVCWLRLVCPSCHHSRPAALAPYIIRWGADASSHLLRQRCVCARCGHRGALTYHPSYVDATVGFEPFPVGHLR